VAGYQEWATAGILRFVQSAVRGRGKVRTEDFDRKPLVSNGFLRDLVNPTPYSEINTQSWDNSISPN
jgi:hypothetical protein